MSLRTLRVAQVTQWCAIGACLSRRTYRHSFSSTQLNVGALIASERLVSQAPCLSMTSWN